MTISAASDRSLMIRFGEEISLAAWREVRRLTHSLEGARGILNLHPAYASLLIDFDPRLYTHEAIEVFVRERLASVREDAVETARTVEIPVQFGGEGGPDLDDVARHTRLSTGEVVESFCGAEYVVYFVGFSTCFPYLGGLPAALATPRLAAPRKHVPEGSVAIGGSQAGVYPLPSPGGWRLIGRTNLRLFDAMSTPPALLRMGDRVKFVEKLVGQTIVFRGLPGL